MFNFLFYLAFVRLFLCTGNKRLSKKFINAQIFFPTIEKLDRPLDTCQSKGENSSSLRIFKKKL